MLCYSYPDATPEDLQATDNVCIICREEMVTGAKKLPCNHIFHSRFTCAVYGKYQSLWCWHLHAYSELFVPLIVVAFAHGSKDSRRVRPVVWMSSERPSQTRLLPQLLHKHRPPLLLLMPPYLHLSMVKTPRPGWSKLLMFVHRKPCFLFCAVVPGMMPQFPPGLFPFWGPFPGAPPPAAPGAQAAPDAPQTSTAATPGAGQQLLSVLPHCENLEYPWFPSYGVL